MNNKPTQSQQEGQEPLLLFTDLITFRATQSSTNGQYAIFEEEVPPLGGPPPHAHPDEEIFYILRGEFQFVLNDLTNPFSAQAGSLIHVPANAVHTFKNVGKTAGKMVVIITPGHLEHYFREVAIPVSEAVEKPDLNVSPDISKIDTAKAFALAEKYGIQFFLPKVISV